MLAANIDLQDVSVTCVVPPLAYSYLAPAVLMRPHVRGLPRKAVQLARNTSFHLACAVRGPEIPSQVVFLASTVQERFCIPGRVAPPTLTP